MSEKRDEMLEHEFDGIREYDNPPPGWIMWMLYASVVIAIAYWFFFHTLGAGRLPGARYKDEMARAAAAQLARLSTQQVSDESLGLMAQVPAQAAEGRAIFEQFCVACHGQLGEGGVGPNLTDPYWLHGGAPLAILRTVTRGVPEKGMVAWEGQLGPARVQKVTAYVLTLKGQNRPGKAPQGEPEGQAPAAAATGGAPADPAARS